MLDFTKQKKKFMTVKLDDETTIFVDLPTYRDLEKAFALENILSNEEVKFEDLGYVYELAAALISRNKNKIKISDEYLKENLSIQDVAIFVKHYMTFISDAMSQKN